MNATSVGRREPFLAHEQRERAFAVAMLVVVKVVAILAMLLAMYLLYPISRPPGWVISAMRGFLLGEAAWFAIWFSLSGSTLRFRIAFVLAALVLNLIDVLVERQGWHLYITVRAPRPHSRSKCRFPRGRMFP